MFFYLYIRIWFSTENKKNAIFPEASFRPSFLFKFLTLVYEASGTYLYFELKGTKFLLDLFNILIPMSFCTVFRQSWTNIKTAARFACPHKAVLAAVPCGHLLSCLSCRQHPNFQNRQHHCWTCRAKVKKFQRIYFS